MSMAKPTTKLTYSHYVLFPDDGNRHEILDGIHYMNPAPNIYHQLISRRIQFQLYTQIELRQLGTVMDAPVDVQLSEFDICQPDLVVVLAANRIVTPTKVKGAPDLVTEILSPATEKNDRVLKRARFEQAGVREYWIIDPEDHQLTQLELLGGAYQQVEHGDLVSLRILPSVSVNLAEVW